MACHSFIVVLEIYYGFSITYTLLLCYSEKNIHDNDLLLFFVIKKSVSSLCYTIKDNNHELRTIHTHIRNKRYYLRNILSSSLLFFPPIIYIYRHIGMCVIYQV